MPVAVSYPGVYIQEVASGVHTITGVSTSIGSFFGRTARGPVNKAVRCLSFADFLREFGGPHPLSDLAQSVRQFFDNGGTDCYVIRLAHFAAGATGKAAITLKNLAATKNVLTATAKQPGLWGSDLKLDVDYNTTNPDDTFNLSVIQETGGVVVNREDFTNLSMMPTSPRFAPTFVTQSSTLIDLALDAADMGVATNPGAFINLIANTPAGYSQSRRPFTGGVAAVVTAFNLLLGTNNKFVISVNGSRDIEVDLSGKTVAGGGFPAVANSFALHVNPILGSAVPGLQIACQWDQVGAARVLRITSDSANFSRVTIRRATADDLAGPMMFGLDQGGIEVARYSNMRPVYNGSVFVGGAAFGDFTDGATGVNNFAGLTQDIVTGIQIAGSPVVPVNLDHHRRGRRQLRVGRPGYRRRAGEAAAHCPGGQRRPERTVEGRAVGLPPRIPQEAGLDQRRLRRDYNWRRGRGRPWHRLPEEHPPVQLRDDGHERVPDCAWDRRRRRDGAAGGRLHR